MKITIVTPSFNQGEFIEETIKSVINQAGNFELEYIIMDAVSEDKSLEIIKKYDLLIRQKKFKPKCQRLIFKWFSEKDKGQSEAINKGFKIAEGEIINWLCADDTLKDGSLQNIAVFFKKNKEAMVVCGNSTVVNENDKFIYQQRCKNFTPDELIRLDMVYNKFFIAQPSVFLRKTIFEKIGPLDESLHLCMDYEWYLRINRRYKFHFIDKTLSFTRYHKNSKTAKFEKENYALSFKLSRKYFKELGVKSRLAYIFNFSLLMWKRAGAKGLLMILRGFCNYI